MKYIVANFKLNGDLQFIDDYAKELNKKVKNPTNMFIALPHIYLHIKHYFDHNAIKIGAQNVSAYQKGAYTGEVSAQMLSDIGADFVIIGHSERRHVFGETNEQIAQKVRIALESGLKVILCVGEKLEEKTKYRSVILSQLKTALKDVDLTNVIIAYEPVWAIGTGKVATAKDIVRVHAFIKKFVKDNYGVEMPVLYGGSVKPGNSSEILKLKEVDGVLVGGASLKAEEFSQIYLSQF